MRKIFFISAIFIFLFSCQKKETVQIQTTNTPSAKDSLEILFSKAGKIKVYEPLRYFIGETDSNDAIYEISLNDIEKYHGKVCPGIASGFFMFKDVIKKLYPLKETAIRGQVAVACSKPNDMFDVAGFIFGIRNFYGRSELGKGLLIVDTALATGKSKQFVLIFKRLDNGKTLKVIFNKFNLMNKDDWPFIDSIIHKYEHGDKISNENLKKFGNLVFSETKRVLNNGVRKNVYIIKDTVYHFPFE